MQKSSDTVIVIVGINVALLLVLVLSGDLINLHLRATFYAILLVSIQGIFITRNVLRTKETRSVMILYIVGVILFGMIVLSIIGFDKGYEPGNRLLLGMPPATALLVLGISLFPMWFMVLWVVFFHKAIVTPEKEKFLAQLKNEKQSNGEVSNG